jgi:hypothetical protein
MVRPDYSGGGFVNLIASIIRGCGGAPRHPELQLLPAREVAAARNVVLVIVDGLGDRYLREQGAGGALASRRRGSMTAVFPSTTASAITTSFTGATPLEHGLTGWFTYFGEEGCVGAPLPFVRRGEKSALAPDSGRLFLEKPLFETLATRSIVVSYRKIVDSVYNRHHCRGAERRAYDDLEGFVGETEAAVKSGLERKFVYAYWPEFDAISHKHGVASAEARAQLEAIDAAFARLLARLSGTDSLVVATADHGFMDSAGAEALELPRELAPMLRFPLCGERRVAFCHVHEPGVFMRKAREVLEGRAEVLLSRQLVEEGWFGDGTPHPRIAERVGDVALFMNGCHTIKDWVPGEPRHLHIGNHGGASEDEMIIPLVVARA